MYETYPKGSTHPSSKVGEQESKASWNAKRTTKYGNTTVKDTVYNGDKNKTKSCTTGSGKAGGKAQVSVTYKGSREKFASERKVS